MLSKRGRDSYDNDDVRKLRILQSTDLERETLGAVRSACTKSHLLIPSSCLALTLMIVKTHSANEYDLLETQIGKKEGVRESENLLLKSEINRRLWTCFALAAKSPLKSPSTSPGSRTSPSYSHGLQGTDPSHGIPLETTNPSRT